MPPPRGRRGNRGNRQPAIDPDEGLDPDLRSLSTAALQDRITLYQDRYAKIARDRNYMQLEKDMVKRFFGIAQQEVRQAEAELLDKDREVEALARDHRVTITVYEQKVHRLTYEHKDAFRTVGQAATTATQVEREDHRARTANLTHEKADLRQDLQDQQFKGLEDVDVMRRGFEKNISRLRGELEHKHQDMQAQYERQVEENKSDLDLNRKSELHEVEERKNKHINELMLNHQAAFAEAKLHFNERTRDSLELAGTLRTEVKELNEKIASDKTRMQTLDRENSELAGPLGDILKAQRELEDKLKTYPKDQIALKNLRGRCKQLEGQLETTKRGYQITEERYKAVEKGRDDIQRETQRAISQNKRRTEMSKNLVLEKKLEKLNLLKDDKQDELSQVLVEAKLDPGLVAHVTKRLEESISARNKQMKDLQFEVDRCTKSYNDTLRVYERRLPQVGIPAGEVEFEELITRSSKMAAGLVHAR